MFIHTNRIFRCRLSRIDYRISGLIRFSLSICHFCYFSQNVNISWIASKGCVGSTWPEVEVLAWSMQIVLIQKLKKDRVNRSVRSDHIFGRIQDIHSKNQYWVSVDVACMSRLLGNGYSWQGFSSTGNFVVSVCMSVCQCKVNTQCHVMHRLFVFIFLFLMLQSIPSIRLFDCP